MTAPAATQIGDNEMDDRVDKKQTADAPVAPAVFSFLGQL